MNMNKLFEIEELGLRITWKLIWLGLNGKDDMAEQLRKEDALEYLNEKLGYSEHYIDEMIFILCNCEDDERTDRYLKRLAERENTSEIIQYRKWQVYLLERILVQPKDDPLQGMLELMEYWTSAGDMSRTPFSLPTQKTAHAYFTSANYQECFAKSKAWARSEIQNIQQTEVDVVGI